jgi:hypothetical protein
VRIRGNALRNRQKAPRAQRRGSVEKTTDGFAELQIRGQRRKAKTKKKIRA